MRAATAIVGAASTGFTKANASRTPISMASVVVERALEDAGLSRKDIDGLVVHIGSPRGVDYDLAASQLGLNLKFAAQPWSHGRFASTAILHGAMALTWGLAEHVLVFASYNNTSFSRHGSKERPTFQESLREGGGPHAETPHAGLTAPVAGTALAATRYFHKYGVDPAKLAAIPLAFRRNARDNPDAAMRKPLSADDYFATRFIVEPLRLLDCSVVIDGAVAVILSKADRARDLRKPPVYILGAQGLAAGPEEFIFGQPGLGINQASTFDYDPRPENQTVFRMAGISPRDVDFFQTYDPFSPLVLWALERFGHCPVGEAADFVQNGRLELDGDFPTNTSGGFLSEGQLNGWGQIMEIVRQLRREAGPRQLKKSAVGQWGTAIGDSIIFGRDP
jgi:acetyl-CoA acetyltransferase